MSPEGWCLAPDEQVRCMTYLARRIRDFADLPEGMAARIIPLGHSALALYTLDGYQVAIQHIPDPFRVEEKIQAFLNEAGQDKMLEISANQPLTWQEILERSFGPDKPSMH